MNSGKPSPSGPRLSGDRYQHLYTWLYGAQLLLKDPRVVRIEFEVSGAGNVDDLKIFYGSAPPIYHQIKFVTSQQEPLNADWFTTVPAGAKKSPLQRFQDSFVKLTTSTGARPEMVLLTNRWPEPDDALRESTSGHTSKLMPRIAQGGERSAAGKMRKTWAEHLGIPESELLELLEHLSLKVGQESMDELYETVSLAMAAAGLRGDRDAMIVGMDIIKVCIEEGTRTLTAETLRPHVAQYQLAAGRASATLLVQAIDHDPWPDAATASVDWVELFEGDDARTRRKLKDQEWWNERMKPELREAVKVIRKHGLSDVNVAGAMRLSTALFVGSELSRVAGFSIRRTDRGQEWSSELEREDAAIARQEVNVGRGTDVAVAVSVSLDITSDVETYLTNAGLPVGKLIVYSPADGVGQESVAGPAHALSLADTIASQLRSDLSAQNGNVHFFIAAPLPVALLIGHRWNRIPTAQLYDDLGPNRGYMPTFIIDG